jgi:carboxymethylenebutenolidase
MGSIRSILTATALGTAVLGLAAISSHAQESKPAAPAGGAQDKAGQDKSTSPFGGMSEEEFAKLHTLKPEDTSPTKGTMVDLPDGSKAYLALPEGWKPGGAALVVIHEWWGLNSHIKHWADRFTTTGRAALAVDLYEGKTATNPKDAGQMMRSVDEKKAIATMLAGLAYLKSDPKIAAGKRGSIGWCFGGGMSLQLAINAPDLDACVMYYGRPVNDPNELKKIKAPLLGNFAKKDQSIPPEAVDVFEKGLKTAGVNAIINEYDANHAFANPSGQSYDAKSATAAWAAVQAFLDKNLPVKTGA